MRKLLRIATSNMKKTKMTVASLVLLVTLTTVLLYCCLSVLMDVESFVDRKNEDLNGASFVNVGSYEFKDKMTSLIQQVDGFEWQETLQAIQYQSSTIKDPVVEKEAQEMTTLVMNYDEPHEMGKVKIIDKGTERKRNSVILPYVLQSSSGYKTGDIIKLSYGTTVRELEVYGFYEDVIYANPSSMMTYKIYVGDDLFETMFNNAGESQKTFYSNVKLKSDIDQEKFEGNYNDLVSNKIKDSKLWYMGLQYESMKVGALAFLEIMVSIMLGLAAIFLIIVLVVIRFSIVTHIESNMANMGMLEAAGYTTRQLRSSMLIEFSIITLAGWLLGILLSYFASPIVGNLVSSAMGLQWIGCINEKGIVFSLAVLAIMVLLTTFLSTRRVKKITPLVALRKGIENFNFKRNAIPLEKTKLGAVPSMGLKNMFHNGKQNRVILILTFVFSFACVFCLVSYYNFVVDDHAFQNLVGVETEDIQITIPNDCDKVIDEINALPQVEKTMAQSGYSIRCGKGDKSMTLSTSVYEDFDCLRNRTIMEGRYPKHDNEIVITNLVAKQLGVKTGDLIQISYNKKEYSYMVVGINQQISMLGKWSGITEDGFKRMEPDYKRTSAYIYLKSGSKAKEVVNELENKYSDEGVQVRNWQVSLKATFASYSGAMVMMCIGCIFVTVVIVALVMYLILKVKVIKERQQFGVWKALGFTTKQLVMQEIISVIAPLLLGSVIGAFGAAYGTNTLLALALGAMGITKVQFTVMWYYGAVTAAGLLGLGIVVVTLVAARVRSIQPALMLQDE